MVRWAERFYQLVSDDEIQAHNNQVHKRYREPIAIPKNNRNKAGYVYLLRGGDYYKIGLSANPNRRIVKEIQPKLPFEVEIIATLQTENMFDLEKMLHTAFSHRRTNGEWFELEPHDVRWIKNLGGKAQ